MIQPDDWSFPVTRCRRPCLWPIDVPSAVSGYGRLAVKSAGGRPVRRWTSPAHRTGRAAHPCAGWWRSHPPMEPSRGEQRSAAVAALGTHRGPDEPGDPAFEVADRGVQRGDTALAQAGGAAHREHCWLAFAAAALVVATVRPPPPPPTSTTLGASVAVLLYVSREKSPMPGNFACWTVATDRPPGVRDLPCSGFRLFVLVTVWTSWCEVGWWLGFPAGRPGPGWEGFGTPARPQRWVRERHGSVGSRADAWPANEVWSREKVHRSRATGDRSAVHT